MAAKAAKPGARFRVVGLDGIRAVAVVAVILFHLTPGGLVGGYVGVDVFFVVSGFLITALLLGERAATGRIRLGAFWKRRARRLLPALGLVVIVCGAAALLVGGDVLVALGTQVVGAATFSSNWLFLAAGSSYFDETVPELFRNLWSLAVEEQFYLVWPLLVLLVLVRIPRGVRLALIGAIAIASAVAMALLWDPGDATRVYYGTDTHAFGLAIGAFLAVLTEHWGARTRWSIPLRGLLGFTGLLALGGLVAIGVTLPAESALPYRGGLVAVSLLTAIVIAALLVPGSVVGRSLELGPIRWIGKRSYGLYLWHWPVFVLVAAAFPGWPRSGTPGWVLGGIAAALTVIAAAVSYRYVEQPIRRDGFRASARAFLDVAPRSRAAFAAILALLLGLGASVATTAAVIVDPGVGEAQGYIEAGQDAIDEAQDPEPPPAAESPTPDATPQTVGGDQISAVGDSVMLAAAPRLQQEFPGIWIDASVSRSMSAAPAIIQQLEDVGALRPVVVVALGTNGPINRETLEKIRDILGPERQLVVVNAQAPRGWIPGVNSTLSAFAQYYRNVELANWHDAIQPSLGELASDQVHFGPAGAAIFTNAVRDALQRLAELPPLRDDSADLSLPRPF
jgi:peptidoglycan/LPS O-acetylase OafA/YrhL